MDTFWIKMRMRSLKLKQKDLAAEMGISVPAVNHKIHNRRLITLKESCVMARCLKMTVDEVMEHLLDEGEKQ